MSILATPTISLTEEQRSAVKTLIGKIDEKQIQTLGGYAGTGKSICVRHLAGHFDDWAVVAYTGKAASVLRKRGVLEARTIHSTIYRPIEEDDGTIRYELKRAEDLKVNDRRIGGFLIDEASMVGKSVLADLKSFGLPIIAVGDHGQLPPVGEDAGLMLRPDIRLETVHRNAGPIARFAEHLRNGGNAADWEGENDGSVEIVHKIEDNMLEHTDQILCAFNRTRVSINRRVRRVLFRREGDKPCDGDRVMCLQNRREQGLFNGMQGVISRVDTKKCRFTFTPDDTEDEIDVLYKEDCWNEQKPEMGKVGEPRVPFEFAYCITCHKSQGSEYDNTIVQEQICKDLWDHRRWAYTAASRAKSHLTWVLA